MKKKKYLSIFRSFEGIDSYLINMDFILKKISKEFDKIFIINTDNLRFFPKNKKYIFNNKVKDLPNNFELFNPKNEKDFQSFIKDKSLVGITVITREFKDLKIHYLFKKYSIPRINITNYGHSGMSQIVSYASPFKAMKWKFRNIFRKFYVVLSYLNFIRGEDIRFLSEKNVINNIQKSWIKRFLYKKKINFAKEIILVNSRNYDFLLENKTKISEDYIVHIDADLNYSQETELRGKLSGERIKNHYHYLNKFLEKLSKEFNKKVIVCIHPSYNLETHQKNLPNFEIIKYKTQDYLYKAYLVTNFDSSAIADAVILKKKIMGLVSNFMTKNEISHSKLQSFYNGYAYFNIQDNLNFKKEELLKTLNDRINYYDISKSHCHDVNISGSDKIIKILKERYFK